MIKIKGINNYLSNYEGLPKQCWEAVILNLINAIFVAICFFLTLYFVDYLYIDLKIAGFLLSCYGAGIVIGGLLAGKLCDKTNPHLIRIGCLFMQGIAFLLLANLSKVSGLIFILFFLGVGGYGFKTANSVLMLSACKDKNLQLKTINISHVASNLGLGISGCIIGFLSSASYLKFFSVAGCMLVLISLYTSPSIIKKSYQFLQKDLLQGEYLSSNTHKQIGILLFTIFSVFFVGLIMAQLSSTYPIYIKETFTNLGTQAVGILFILDTILIVLFQTPLSNYYRRFNTLLVMGLGAFLMGLGMIILSIAANFFLAIVSCIIWTTGEMLFLPTAQLVCYEYVEKNKKGQIMGIFQSTYAMSTVIGPLIGGVIYVTYSSNTIWYISGIIGLMCLIGTFFLVSNKKMR